MLSQNSFDKSGLITKHAMLLMTLLEVWSTKSMSVDSVKDCVGIDVYAITLFDETRE